MSRLIAIASFTSQSIVSYKESPILVKKLLSEKARLPPLLRWLYQPYRIQKHIPARAGLLCSLPSSSGKVESQFLRFAALGKALETRKVRTMYPMKPAVSFFWWASLLFFISAEVTEDFPQMKAQKTHETTNTISKNIGERIFEGRNACRTSTVDDKQHWQSELLQVSPSLQAFLL